MSVLLTIDLHQRFPRKLTKLLFLGLISLWIASCDGLDTNLGNNHPHQTEITESPNQRTLGQGEKKLRGQTLRAPKDGHESQKSANSHLKTPDYSLKGFKLNDHPTPELGSFAISCHQNLAKGLQDGDVYVKEIGHLTDLNLDALNLKSDQRTVVQCRMPDNLPSMGEVGSLKWFRSIQVQTIGFDENDKNLLLLVVQPLVRIKDQSFPLNWAVRKSPKEENGLGNGCFGTVYKGRLAGKAVAIKKFIKKDPSSGQMGEQRSLFDEALDLLELSKASPGHVANVFGVWVDRDEQVMALELLDPIDVSLNDEKPFHRFQCVASQLLLFVDKIESQNLRHGDIAPCNMGLVPSEAAEDNPVVKVYDPLPSCNGGHTLFSGTDSEGVAKALLFMRYEDYVWKQFSNTIKAIHEKIKQRPGEADADSDPFVTYCSEYTSKGFHLSQAENRTLYFLELVLLSVPEFKYWWKFGAIVGNPCESEYVHLVRIVLRNEQRSQERLQDAWGKSTPVILGSLTKVLKEALKQFESFSNSNQDKTESGLFNSKSVKNQIDLAVANASQDFDMVEKFIALIPEEEHHDGLVTRLLLRTNAYSKSQIQAKLNPDSQKDLLLLILLFGKLVKMEETNSEGSGKDSSACDWDNNPNQPLSLAQLRKLLGSDPKYEYVRFFAGNEETVIAALKNVRKQLETRYSALRNI